MQEDKIAKKISYEEITGAIKDEIRKSLNCEIYENCENRSDKDDYELDLYEDKIHKISMPYYDAIDFVNKCDVVRMKDDELKEQILNSKTFENKCDCLDLESIELYNLLRGGAVEQVGENKVAHIFCNKCKEYNGNIYYTWKD
ncbi:MAG: hypothetical protein RR745_05755 [Bacilli bacterium]